MVIKPVVASRWAVRTRSPQIFYCENVDCKAFCFILSGKDVASVLNIMVTELQIYVQVVLAVEQKDDLFLVFWVFFPRPQNVPFGVCLVKGLRLNWEDGGNLPGRPHLKALNYC